MDVNAINLQTQPHTVFSEFGFNIAFFIGLAAGFILGIFASYLGNYLWERHKKKRRGTEPYCDISITGDTIRFEAQMPNTEATQNVLTKVTKSTAPS